MNRRTLRHSQTAAGVQNLLRRIGIVFALFILIHSVVSLSGTSLRWVVLWTGCSFAVFLLRTRGRPNRLEKAVTLAGGAVATYLGAGYVVSLYAVLISRDSFDAGKNQTFRLTALIALLHAVALLASGSSVTAASLARLAFDWLLLLTLTVVGAYLGQIMLQQRQEDADFVQLSKDNEWQRQKALTDELTGLGNYRAYRATVENTSHYILLLLDLDKFKQLNDTFGHVFGNEVLIRMGLMLQQTVRFPGMVFRYGGEEFAVLLPNDDIQQAGHIAEMLRQLVAGHTFQHNGLPVKVTISIGASVRCTGVSAPQCFKHADEALYLAKRSGRNRVQWCMPERPENNVSQQGEA